MHCIKKIPLNLNRFLFYWPINHLMDFSQCFQMCSCNINLIGNSSLVIDLFKKKILLILKLEFVNTDDYLVCMLKNLVNLHVIFLFEKNVNVSDK